MPEFNFGIILRIVFPLVRFFYKKISKAKAYYSVIWKKSSKLKPEEVLGIRAQKRHGFDEYYYPFQQVDQIKERVNHSESVLVTGNPLAGKTRAIYQAILSLNEPCDVIIPKVVDVNTETFQVPFRLGSRRKGILVLDDIDKFAGKQNFTYLLGEFQRRDVIILATCRSGIEYDMLCASMEREMALFGDPIELSKVSEETAEQVAKQVGKELPDTFDGNIGSIFVPLDTMRQRFKEAAPEEKGILRSLKRLHSAGIFRGKEVFSLERLKLACEKLEGIKKEKYEWRALIDSLIKNGFVGKVSERPAFMEKVEEQIQTEETYLEQVIEDDFSPLDNLNEMLAIFDKDPDAAFDIGDKADDIARLSIGKISKQKADFEKLAIKAYNEALETWTLDSFPENYARTQNNLGIALRTLAEVENKADNCHQAIRAYQEALKVYTLDRFPMDYGMTQNNLGNALRTLAEVENKSANCQLAIAAYQGALKVYTLDRFPMDYGMTQNNLGNAYLTLADVENKADNCRRAITSYQEALKVFTLERFMMDYGMTQNNLGSAFGTLAEVENKADNCRRAITSHQEALKVYTLERLPMQYGATQNNLGTAYGTLAEVENKTDNCRRAITAYQEALKVYTLERFPMQFAATQNNLGTAFHTLAEVENKADNCRRAIEAFKEALKVYTLERFPMDYGMMQNNLGVAYSTLAEVENKADNCRRAITAFQEALKVRTLERFPMQYGNTQNNLGNTYRVLAEVEDKSDNCKRAIIALQEALKVYTLEHFPMQYATTQVNLGVAYRRLAEAEEKAENCKKAKRAYEEALKIYTEELPEPHAVVIHNLRILDRFCEDVF